MPNVMDSDGENLQEQYAEDGTSQATVKVNATTVELGFDSGNGFTSLADLQPGRADFQVGSGTKERNAGSADAPSYYSEFPENVMDRQAYRQGHLDASAEQLMRELAAFQMQMSPAQQYGGEKAEGTQTEEESQSRVRVEEKDQSRQKAAVLSASPRIPPPSMFPPSTQRPDASGDWKWILNTSEAAGKFVDRPSSTLDTNLHDYHQS
jgi:hypothetical protein